MARYQSRHGPPVRYDRIVRIVAFVFAAITLVALSVGEPAPRPLIYLILATAIAVIVAEQDLVTAPASRAWYGVQVATVLAFISVVVALAGGAGSPLVIGYVLLAASAGLTDDWRVTVSMGGAAAVSYAVTSFLAPAVVGAAASRAEAVLLVAGAIGLATLTATTLTLWRRRTARRASERQRLVAAPVPVLGNELSAVVVAAPPTLTFRAPEPAEALQTSIRGLLTMSPEMSAFHTLSGPQTWFLIGLLGLFAAGLVVVPFATLITFNAVVTGLYLLALGFNLAIFRALLRRPPMVKVSDAEARAIPDDQLPSYTVLMAAYHEQEIIAATIRALESLDYPRDRLDILVLLEEDDRATIQAAMAARPAAHVRIVVVPDALPKTKPKACNYGLQFSTGELVTIFDAEDRPDPLQLRRAAAAFARLPPAVACLQAQLHFHNERQNLLTRWFAAEYVTWFSSVLPALVSLGAPLPLGGTSMHVRRKVLDAVGAWDPFNVTEDADLGIRLARAGYQTLVLDSVTLEEANSDFINWVKQRSRWYKGYLQTWLVHVRQPRRLWRELRPAGVLGFSVLLGTTPLLALLNPFFWLLTAIWFLTESPAVQALFPWWVFYPALVSVVFGNFLALYRTMVAVRVADRPMLVLWVLVVPFYWVFMSIAALRAFVQLLIAPSVWEKTLHGLDRVEEAAPLRTPH